MATSSDPRRVVTFDLWDTVFVDDSDEPKRAAAGLPRKPVERRAAVHRALERHGAISRERVDAAYDAVDVEFGEVWREEHVTWTVAERLARVLAELRRELPAGELADLARFHEEMELRFRPDVTPGAVEAIRALRGRWRLGVISDAIFSPGRTLRELLAGAGLGDCFEAHVFSDEVGCSKPAPAAFEAAARALGVAADDLIHVGDREHNDVHGAHAAGARAVLCAVIKDRGSATTKADAVLGDYGRLAEVLEGLAGARGR